MVRAHVIGQRRSLFLAGAIVVIAAAVTFVALRGEETVTGASDEPDTSFKVVGDGSLPTERPKLGKPLDQLSAAETGYAIHLATTDAHVPATATNVRGEQGPEVVLVQVPNDPHLTSRQASVVLYDYSTDTTYQQTVDLAVGKVVKSANATGVQVAPNNDEADVAMQIAIDAGGLPLHEAFLADQGVDLTTATQVSYNAGAFTYDGSTSGGQECGQHRCVSLIVQTASHAYLPTTEFAVDLSSRSVVRFE